MAQALRDFPEARWEALAELLIRKRVEISPRYHKRSVFAREVGLNYRLIYEIEKHRRRDFTPPTIIAIEQVYRLPAGFIRQFLAAREGDDEPELAKAS